MQENQNAAPDPVCGMAVDKDETDLRYEYRDKTGTLTEGKPKLAAVQTVNGFDRERVLCYAASLERGSEHPLAAAVVSGAESWGIKVSTAADFESVTGKGQGSSGRRAGCRGECPAD